MFEWMRSHPLIMLLAGAVIITFIWLTAIRKRLSIKWYAAALLALLNVLIGVLCVKFFAVVEAGFDFSKFSGQSLFGAVFFLPLFYYLGSKLFKRKPADVFDCFTVPTVFTLFCARICCLLTGCCLGKDLGGFRVPTREAELVFYAVLLVFIVPRVLGGRGRGESYPIFMIAYGAFRFVCEFFRESASFPGVFHLSHVWAVITFALGLCIYFELKRRSENKHAKNKAR